MSFHTTRCAYLLHTCIIRYLSDITYMNQKQLYTYAASRLFTGIKTWQFNTCTKNFRSIEFATKKLMGRCHRRAMCHWSFTWLHPTASRSWEVQPAIHWSLDGFKRHLKPDTHRFHGKDILVSPRFSLGPMHWRTWGWSGGYSWDICVYIYMILGCVSRCQSTPYLPISGEHLVGKTWGSAHDP